MRGNQFVTSSNQVAQRGQLEQDAAYPFSAQYRGVNGDLGWYVFDASTGGWGTTKYASARDAQVAAYQTKLETDKLKQLANALPNAREVALAHLRQAIKRQQKETRDWLLGPNPHEARQAD